MPVWRLGKGGFRFNANHSFPNDAGYDRHLHGHDYELTLLIEGLRATGEMVFDARQLKPLVEQLVIARLDHTNLNELLPDASSEALAEWIWQQLRPQIPPRLRLGIHVWETRTTFVEYWGD